MIEQTPKRILVLGASGMLGNAVLRQFAIDPRFAVTGTTRTERARALLSSELQRYVIAGVDAENVDTLISVMAQTKPDIVINCIGLIKQLAEVNDPLTALPVNATFPHRLARLCAIRDARLIHVSTDCVFDGAKGDYVESDQPNAYDLYGRSKFLGEVDYPNAITLRTSIIGHELDSANALVDWFLAQEGRIKGYRRAIFSGLPTAELARVIRDYVLPFPSLRGLYHVSASPIAKYDLLELVARIYGKTIEIIPDEEVRIDRSLNSNRFQQATGYSPPAWPELIALMHQTR